MNRLPPIPKIKEGRKAEAIFFALKELILSGKIKKGERLPSTRQIAKFYSVDKSTVLEAIKLLKSFGLVETNPGSGVMVSVISPSIPFSSTIDLIEKIEQKEEISKEDDLKFYFLMPDKKIFPYDYFKGLMEEILEKEKENFFEYKEPMGYLPLREWIAKRLNAKVDEVIIVNGAQQALSILCQLFLSNSSRVLIENPTYPGIIPLLRLYNAEVSTIPLKKNGICHSTLKHLLSSPFKFLYIQPTNQNPTGITTDEKSRMEIIKYLPRHQVCVIEDSADPIFGERKTIFEMDPLKRVVHIGSFSKAFIPGFRVGWICGNRDLIRGATYIKALQDLQTPLLLQILIYHFLNSGEFERYLKNMKKSLKEKVIFIKKLQKKYFPEIKLNLNGEAQGIWFPVPEGFSSSYVEEKLKEKGIRVASGERFFYQKTSEGYIRIAHLNSSNEEIENLFIELKKIFSALPLRKENKITLIV